MDSINMDNLPLSREKMPESWFQDERMNSMFAEFRCRSVNPQDWNSKYKFWEELISNWLTCHKRCSFSLNEINAAFKRKGCTPKCLVTVIEEMLKNCEIITEDQFINESSATWASWAVDLIVKKPFSWSITKVKNYLSFNTPPSPDVKYVHLKAIKQLAEIILNMSKNKKLPILPLSEIVEKCREIENNENIDEYNIKLALVWINKSKRNQTVLKFCNDTLNKEPSLLKISANGIDNLSEQEEGLFKLTETERAILQKIKDLEIEKNENIMKAKVSINSGLKEVTKTYLRKKKELEYRIEKQAATLHNIQVLISNIHDAKSNNEILAAYKKGGEILKNFEKAGLSEIHVRDTMDDITEKIEEFGETQNALAESLKINLSTDAELEEELADLMNSNSPNKLLPSVPDDELAEFEKELKDLYIDEFPDVPKNLPLSTPTQKSKQNYGKLN